MRSQFETNNLESDRVESAVDKLDSADLERRIQDAEPVSDNVNATVDVPLEHINPTEIQSASDFASPEKYAAMRREVGMLAQMQPALNQGANLDTFDAWDKSNQIGHYSADCYVRGYTDVYHCYYGVDAIALERKPDGTLDVLNGRHRRRARGGVGADPGENTRLEFKGANCLLSVPGRKFAWPARRGCCKVRC